MNLKRFFVGRASNLIKTKFKQIFGDQSDQKIEIDQKFVVNS